jgi:hypothetical protein
MEYITLLQNSFPWSDTLDSGALYLTIHLSNSVLATTVADLCGIAATSQNFVNPSFITMTYFSPLLVVFKGPIRSMCSLWFALPQTSSVCSGFFAGFWVFYNWHVLHVLTKFVALLDIPGQ